MTSPIDPNPASSDAAPAEMPPELVHLLLGGQTSVVATVDEHGRPTTSLMTWVVARNQQTLAIAVDHRGRSFANIRQNPQVAVEVLADDVCYGLRGHAVIEKEQMTSAPFPCALVALHLEECKNHGAAGVKFVGPRYHFAPDKQHRHSIEQSIFNELKGAAPTV